MSEDFEKGQMHELEANEVSIGDTEEEKPYDTERIIREVAESEKSIRRRRRILKFLRNFMIDLAVAVLLAVAFLHFFQPNFVYQESMYPTYTDRDMILVNKTAYNNDDPQRGDIIVFFSHYEDNKRFIKRVIAVENDTVSIHGGKVWVNGVEQNQSYTNKGVTDGNLELTVPEHSCFVLGDNRTVSIDSRSDEIGCINYDDIVGKVMFTKDVVLDKGAK